MDRIKKKLARRAKIRQGIRKKLTGTAERPRLSVYRSNTAIYAQIINDENGQTLLSSNSLKAEKGKKPVELAYALGKELAEKAVGSDIKDVVFDRNGYLYHGRVKALAEGAREGGLNF